MKPAAEGQSAVLLIEGEGVQLQITCRHHLDGFVVLHHPGRVDIHIGDGRGLPYIHTNRGKNMTYGEDKSSSCLQYCMLNMRHSDPGQHTSFSVCHFKLKGQMFNISAKRLSVLSNPMTCYEI